MTGLPAVTRRLDGRCAVVTGGASGLGRAACLRFAAEGAAVVVADVDETGADRVVTEIAQAGGRALGVGVDVGAADEVEEMVLRAVDFGRGVDVLYANAGVGDAGAAHSTDSTTWERVLRINLTGTWACLKAVLPVMVEAGRGSVITQSSIAGLVGVPDLAAYSASKGGVIALTRQVAAQYGPQGIRANVICPGTVVTPLVRRTLAGRGMSQIDGGAVDAGSEDGVLTAAARRYPLRRLGTPEEVAAVAAFLASDDAAWVTGAVITADGGSTAQ